MLIRLLYLLMLSGAMCSLPNCSPPSSIGADFFPEESFVVEESEAIDIAVRTIALDSVASSNVSRLVVGWHRDSLLGLVNSKAYLQLLPDDATILDDDSNYRYDSITLVLPYDGYYFYDTLQTVSLAIHRLAEELTPYEDEDNFYTTNQYAYDPTPLAQISFVPKPRRKDDLEVRLPNELGLDFFNRLIEGELELLNDNEFSDYFPGLVLVPQTVGGAMLGFSKTIRLNLHFTDVSELSAGKKVRSFSGTRGVSFNQISTDRTGTQLAGIDEDTSIASHATGETAFLQTGSVLMARVDFPDLRNNVDIDEETIVVRAELTFSAIDYPVQSQEALPRQVSVFWVNQDDEIINSNSSATLVLDTEFGRDTYYTVDVTSFIQYRLGPESNEEYGLALSVGNSADGVHSLRIGDARHPDKMELSLLLLKLRDN